MSCSKCKEGTPTIGCGKCQIQFCPHQLPKEHLQHYNQLFIICQQCQENQSLNYCESCQQHLCAECNHKIHNKAKRAKHVIRSLTTKNFLIKECYLVCLDNFLQKNIDDVLSHITGSNNFHEKLILMQGNQPTISKQFTIFTFNNQTFNNEVISNITNYYPFINIFNVIDSPSSKKLLSKINISQIIGEFKVIKISLFNESLNNDSFRSISSSTENSMKKKNSKAPILYFQPWLTTKNDKNWQIQETFRNLAEKGNIMIKKQNNCKYDDSIIRSFSRNIGQSQIEYISMKIEIISIECLCWVIRSIKLDKMTPSQKLILSRLKQSFDIKMSVKQWQNIIKYILSNHYKHDWLDKDPTCILPYILIKNIGQENILIFKNEEWVFEDQGIIDEHSCQWKQFVELLNDYFITNTQIGGGRYGCVQYAKLKSSKPLKDCSLGKLSLFVQQAINKGIIRYHKTLIVSNNDSQSFINNKSLQMDLKLMQLHRDVKTLTLQLNLVDLLLEHGKGVPISLAQIPLNLKKKVPFEVNFIQLGFPKLKNLLVTITDKLTLQSTKSHISYQIHSLTFQILEQQKLYLYQQTNMLLSYIINAIQQISLYHKSLVLDELYNKLNTKIGFVFDSKIFNIQDFYQFIAYYCREFIQIQIFSGLFVAYSRIFNQKLIHQLENPQYFPKAKQIQPKKIQTIKWESYDDLFNEFTNSNSPQFIQEQQYQSYSDYRCIEKVLQDNSQSKIYTTTAIQKQDIVFSSIDGRSDYDGKSFGVQELQIINQAANSPRNKDCVYSPRNNDYVYSPKNNQGHHRVNSNISQASKSSHNRVRSNFTKN